MKKAKKVPLTLEQSRECKSALCYHRLSLPAACGWKHAPVWSQKKFIYFLWSSWWRHFCLLCHCFAAFSLSLSAQRCEKCTVKLKHRQKERQRFKMSFVCVCVCDRGEECCSAPLWERWEEDRELHFPLLSGKYVMIEFSCLLFYPRRCKNRTCVSLQAD